MPKKSKKHRKSKSPNRPNLSPLTMLRPRLDGLMNNPEWLDRTDTDILTDLVAVVRNIEAHDYLPIMVRAVNSASPEVSGRLNQLIPNWLLEGGNVETLLALLDEEMIGFDDQPLAKEWLIQTGMDQEQLHKEQESTFFEAYYGQDHWPSQGILLIFWYTNRRRNRLSGLNTLVDFNPPWEGATKEQYILPQKPIREMHKLVSFWQERLEMKQLDGAEAKAKLAEILLCNHKENIRLHGDLIPERAKVIQHVLSLPDSPDGPSITQSEFDTLCAEGQKPEQLMFREQTMGRRVRTEDGKEVLVMGDPFDEDEL